MSIFTIGDLHLSFGTNKPMNIFGDNWNNFENKIKNDWLSKVNDNDLVVLPGDFSWAMNLKDTYKDFEYINNFPGMKILLKGNHDYWWNTVKKMRSFITDSGFNNIDFLYNNSFEFSDKIISGVRGWNLSENIDDIRLNKREIDRLELSIKDGIEKFGNNKEIIVFMHYPPITKSYMHTGYIDIMKKYGVKKCFFGHLHADSINNAVNGKIEGIDFTLVSADSLDFKLLKII